MRIEESLPDKSTPIIAYCAGGTRSLLAGRILKELGYQDVVSMRGGFTAWKNQGLPVTEDRQFTPEQQVRYSRHFLLPEVGEAGQAKPPRPQGLCIGARRPRSPAAVRLAPAGGGPHAHPPHGPPAPPHPPRHAPPPSDRMGTPRPGSPRAAPQALTRDVRVVEFGERLSSETASRLFERFDVIVTGCDTSPPRYLANDACVIPHKP